MYDSVNSQESWENNERAASDPEMPAAELSGIHILCVDDDQDALEITTFVLMHAGANVTSVSSGADALQAMGQLVPDVLISDVGMPDIDGYLLMEKIRALPSGKGCEVKAIALSAYIDQESRDRAIAAGFLHYLTKPAEMKVLVQTVLKLVNGELC